MNDKYSVAIPLVLYGIPFHNFTMEEAVAWASERVRTGRPCSIAIVDLQMISDVWADPELRRILVNADLVLADGAQIARAAEAFGPAFKPGVGHVDITSRLMKCAAQEKMSVYALGHAKLTLQKALAKMKIKHPALNIAGVLATPKKPLLEMDHEEIVRKLADASPDILFVAFDSPKQEKFISMHVPEWKIPVTIGVGPAFDYIAGTRKKIPAGLRKKQLDGLGLLLTAPGAYQQFRKNMRFLKETEEALLQLRQLPAHPIAFQALDEPAISKLRSMNTVVEQFIPLKSEMDARKFVSRISTVKDKNIILDIHEVGWLDSLELGALLEMNKRCRKRSSRLILYAPRIVIRRLLELIGLFDFFATASRLDILYATLKSLNQASGGTLYREGLLTLDLPAELTAATVHVYEKEAEFIQNELKQQGVLKTVRVNAANLEFIDSSGLGFLIALKKHTMDEGVEMVVANLDEKPRRIFEIARVDQVLLGE